MRKLIAMLVVTCAIFAHATTNEITVTTSLKVKKDSVQLERKSGTILIQMDGKRYNTQVLTLTTTNQVFSKGSVENAGMCYMRNLGAAGEPDAHITFDNGSTTSHVFKAGEPALFRLAPSAVVSEFTGAASSNSVDFEITIIEE